LTVDVPDHFALYALGVGLVLTLLVIALGAVRVIARVRALKTRIENYKELPIFKQVELAEARIEIGSRAAEKLPDLTDRTNRAIAELQAAKATLAAAATTTTDTLRYFLSIGPPKPGKSAELNER
jgi:hypothetical protein